MATAYWNPFGVAMNITATGGTVTRTSATTFTVRINASWEVYYSGNKTNYGMTASAGGGSVNLNSVGTNAASGSGSFTGTFSISGYGAQTKSITVTFRNYNDLSDSAYGYVAFNVSVPAWPSYTVSYNANGGSGAPSSQTKYKDTTLKLQTTVPTRTGYSFKDWNTASGGTGKPYASGANYTDNSAVTLYAQWTANTYIIKYDANGGTGAPGNQTKTYGVNLTLSSTKPTRTNYNFLGWSTSSTGSVNYSAGGIYSANSAATLYAVWELAYWKPKITKLKATRCDSDGTDNEYGTYAKITFDWELCQLLGTNTTATIAISLGSDTPTTFTGSGTSDSVSKVVGGSLSIESSYTYTVKVTDNRDNTMIYVSIPASAFAIDILAEGKGIAFGKPASLANTMEIAYATKLTGGITPVDIPASSNLNDYTKPGFYCCKLNVNAETMTNIPEKQAFVLEVMESAGVKQVFTTYHQTNFNSYIRQMYNNTWGAWKRIPYQGDVPMLKDKTSISSSANLNSITTPGTYACGDAVAKTLTNCPSTVGFTMDVSQAYETDDYLMQNLYLPYDGIEYRRRQTVSSSSWSAWKQNHFTIGTGHSKILATTSSYMNADQTVSFSEKVSDQPNGIILVWSWYSGGASNQAFIFTPIPKSHVVNHETCGVCCSGLCEDGHMAKYVYIHDTKVTGYSGNSGTKSWGGVSCTNSSFVLRYVIGY